MERIFEEFKKTADKVSKKSTELVSISKIKFRIANTKSEISAAYKELGRLVYNGQKNDDDIAEAVEKNIQTLDDLHEKLNEQENAMAELKNKKICPMCDENCDTASVFCQKCGYHFDNDDDIVTEVVTDDDSECE